MTGPTIGLHEWFQPGEKARVLRVLDDLDALGVRHFRTGVSWADWYTPEGEDWYEWLIPTIGSRFDLLPCFVYTPPSLGLRPHTSAPPRNTRAFADFVDAMITRFGDHFDHVELWNKPNNRADWDWTLDPDGSRFAATIGPAARGARSRGKRVVLGGMHPIDPQWLDGMFRHDVMDDVDVVGVQGFPRTWEPSWDGWRAHVRSVQDVLDAHGHGAAIWITEVGYSTWTHRERDQLTEFLDVLAAPQAARAYWHAVHDLAWSRTATRGHHTDARAYHFGLRDHDGRAKLLHRLWAEDGLDGVRDAAWLTTPADVDDAVGGGPVVVTGGAGFVGANLAHRLLSEGRRVIVLDNLVRPTAVRNARWLRREHDGNVQFEVADVRDAAAVKRVVTAASAVFHCAGQVAVTTSLAAPREDFDVNAQGTLNVLEAVRARDAPVPVVFTSTNKVYGRMPDVDVEKEGDRYVPTDPVVKRAGVGEARPLDFHSPYGCSKGAADQYVLDYARTYDLPATVFRMSCIYGPHQFGTEDQGWVAHFLIRALQGEPITIFGDGHQVRDTLFVNDLVDAFRVAESRIRDLAGHAFNVGGGPGNTLSLLEFLDLIEELEGVRPDVRFADWRPGDQPWYVSDVRAFSRATGWKPRTGVRDGVRELHAWLREALDKAPARTLSPRHRATSRRHA